MTEPFPGEGLRVATPTASCTGARPGVPWGPGVLSGPTGMCFLLLVSPEKSLEQELGTPILDIEDLVKSGNRHK